MVSGNISNSWRDKRKCNTQWNILQIKNMQTMNFCEADNFIKWKYIDDTEQNIDAQGPALINWGGITLKLSLQMSESPSY